MKVHCSYNELADIHTLQEHPKNPNQHPEKQVKLLAKIMEHQGWRNPVTVSKRSGFVVAGHGRLAAAKLNGWDKVPVDLQDFENEAQEYAHIVADNKIQELSEMEDSVVIDLVNDLGPDFPENFDLDLFGYENLEIPGLTFDPAEDGEEQPKLDDVAIKILECPHCKGTFEKKQAKVIQ